MKKIVLLIICFILMTFNVEAAGDVQKPGDPNFEDYKSQYQKGLTTITITSGSNQIVSIPGYSSCDSTGCSYKYMNYSTDYKEVLKNIIKCSGGEKYINIQQAGSVDGFKSDNKANYVGEVYWLEEFGVNCTSSSSSSAITLNTQSSGGSTTGDYSSSNTTTNPNQGVETYYIILGLVGVISYFGMIVTKKFNLFKNV